MNRQADGQTQSQTDRQTEKARGAPNRQTGGRSGSSAMRMQERMRCGKRDEHRNTCTSTSPLCSVARTRDHCNALCCSSLSLSRFHRHSGTNLETSIAAYMVKHICHQVLVSIAAFTSFYRPHDKLKVSGYRNLSILLAIFKRYIHLSVAVAPIPSLAASCASSPILHGGLCTRPPPFPPQESNATANPSNKTIATLNR